LETHPYCSFPLFCCQFSQCTGCGHTGLPCYRSELCALNLLQIGKKTVCPFN
jgi:hypothetical protein